MTRDLLRLREYQAEAVQHIEASWYSTQRPAVVLPTGSGKTVIFSHLAVDWLYREETRVVILVHRDELADQAIDKLRAVAPNLSIGKVKAQDDDVSADVVVCSVQTLARKSRLDRLLSCPRPVGLVIVDEAHHAAAKTYVNIMERLGCYTRSPEDSYGRWFGTRAVGFSATLIRGDGVGLGTVWQDVVYSKSVLWMISRGYLTDVRPYAIDLEDLDLSTVKRSGGDYQSGDLGRALVDANGPEVIAKAVRTYASDRRSIVFTPDVFSAHAAANALNFCGIACEVVSAGTPREARLAIYADFRTGRIKALVNCMVLTEGADFPWADCAVIARPTSSPGLYVQMVGRVLRPWQGKTDAMVLDVTGTGGKLSTLIDLAPGVVRDIQPGESLADAAVRTEERDNQTVDAENVIFALRHRDIDLFAASTQSWLRTPAGVMFIPVAKAVVVLWPSDTEGTWDVWLAPPRGAYKLLHESLPIGSAMAWAETDAEDMAPFNGTRTAGWRKERALPKQLAVARSMGCPVTENSKKGEVSDMISIAEASHKFDARMRRVQR